MQSLCTNQRARGHAGDTLLGPPAIELQLQQSLTLCFDQMMKYKEEPFFLYAMKAMMYTAASRYGDDSIDARQQMRRARALLENFDWHNFCAQLELYLENPTSFRVAR